MDRKQKDVHAFHRALGFTAKTRPSVPSGGSLRMRQRLVAKEARELCEALDRGHLGEIAGECVDLLYVVYGTAVACGVDLDPHWHAVHRANMQKQPPRERGGKAIKPDGWEPVDHGMLVAAQVIAPEAQLPRGAWLLPFVFLALAAIVYILTR